MSRVIFVTWGGAFSGVPAAYGGCGAYSAMSRTHSAYCRSRSCPTSDKPKSIPAVTPPAVILLRSRTIRPLVAFLAIEGHGDALDLSEALWDV
jgi:hypothetical protein